MLLRVLIAAAASSDMELSRKKPFIVAHIVLQKKVPKIFEIARKRLVQFSRVSMAGFEARIRRLVDKILGRSSFPTAIARHTILAKPFLRSGQHYPGTY